METLTRSQARKVAAILMAYANKVPVQWKPEFNTAVFGKHWRDGAPQIKSREYMDRWIRSHRIKPKS